MDADRAWYTSAAAEAPGLRGTQPRATILIVDDSPENLFVLNAALNEQYRVLAATSGERALRIAAAQHPDLVLLDIRMPAMDGFDVLQQLRACPATCDIPVILITAVKDSASELRALGVGAVDYLSRPVLPAIVRARVHSQLEFKSVREQLEGYTRALKSELGAVRCENQLLQHAGISALTHLLELRDVETGHHLRRLQAYVRRLALMVRERPRLRAQLSDEYIDLLGRSAPLHDIGKVAIPDSILRKAGPLTAEERHIMQSHTLRGAEAIEQTERDSAQPLGFLTIAKQIARSHHENWDGSGYPDALRGEAIPLAARLIAIVDVFDALVTRRVYKAAMPFEHARGIIQADSGTKFDPDIAAAFVGGYEEFVDIARRNAEPMTEG